ncbi:hypothetical protein SE23_19360 [Vibrio sinaloensis]|uniref:bifunctional diguanylate cyclase/phosphodiesterase n=1 Tax=Photobacterium sp. (strain ATCC 43367) TaxID=379097 RepID=UPI00057EB82E|nr:EAL domain-containing protein [Vibrio sinaloensis]KIE19157.1 hypothetical protein SE23_19360 [Vibrio sinaloensis]
MDSTSLAFHTLPQLEQKLESIPSVYQRPLIQLFSAQPKEEVLTFYTAIKQRWPNATVIGSSALSTIEQGNINKGDSLLVLTQFEQATFTTASASFVASSRQASEQLHEGLSIGLDTKMIICFGDRMSSSDKALFSAFSHDTVPVVGGATVITTNGRWAFLDGEFHESSLVAVAINAPQLHVWQKSYNEWNPVGQTFIVTQAQGARVLTLNDEPIGQIYRRYLADGNDFSPEMLHGFPMMKGEQKAQDIYTPVSLAEDLSIEFDKPLNIGDKVRFCYDHPELTIQQVQQGAYHLVNFQPDNIFIYNCTSRLDFIEGNSELLPLQSVADSFGFYCMGELFKEECTQSILHHSMTLVAMREGEATSAAPQPEFQLTSPVSPLFSMIRNSFIDLEIDNQLMQKKVDSQARALMTSYRTDRRTGLPNRAVLLEDIAGMELDDCLFNIKINNLTDINEKYGYSVGDNVLVLLTSFLKSQMAEFLPKETKLYAIGVGEWATIFSKTLAARDIREEFEAFIEKIESFDFNDLSFLDSTHLVISVTAGIAEKKEFLTCSADSLLFKTIEARRWATKNNRYLCDARDLVQQEHKRKESLERLSVANHAIIHQNVVPYGQPIYDAKTRDIVSYECLARLTHGDEVLPPGYFLPLVQGTRLYTKFSQQMIASSFAAMSSRHDHFTLNLSPQDILDDNTLALLEQHILALKQPSRVGIEIVESEQISDFSQMIDVCNHFRKLGVKIIVDDFGSGYSNLDEIVQLQPDIIKLDGSLIRQIDHDKKQRKITSQLIRLCQVFEAKTVAEFIHNQAVCEIATEMGVDYLQGFYLGEPKPLD